MAETIIRTVETATSTLAAQSSPQVQTNAPIVQLLPILKAISSGTLYIVNLTFSLIVKPFLIFSPIPILLYVFAPVIVFLQLVLSTFIWTPYKIALYFLDALYPLYVFCGVACITGGILGIVARLLSQALVVNVVAVKTEQDDKGVKVKTEEGEPTPLSVDVKGKEKKVEKVKFES